MTIKQVLNNSTEILQEKKIASAFLDAEVLLTYILKKPKEYLYTYPERKLITKQQNDLTKLIRRRLKGEPVAYLIHKKEFFGLDFYVDKNVLIPRPETEMLVEEITEYIRQRIRKCGTYSHPSKARLSTTIADIGTGSGCIAIALAKNLPKSKIIAIDRSKNALKIAKKNAVKHKVDKHVTFLSGNLLTPIIGKKIDVIVANLPYLKANYLKNNTSTSLKFEPKTALSAGIDGLAIYKQFFGQLAKYNFNNVSIFAEIGYNQGTVLKKYLSKLYPQGDVEIKKDLSDFDRVMKIKI